MSFFNGLFGRGGGRQASAPAQPKAPNADETIKNMKGTQEMLEKKKSILEAKIAGETQNALRLKSLMQKNPRKKNEALMCIKRKKMFEKEYVMLDNQIVNLDQTIFAMERAITNEAVVTATRNANSVMSSAIGQTDVNDVEELYDDIQSNMEDLDEIANVLGQDLNIGGEQLDEDDLMNELNEIGEEADADAFNDFSDNMLGPAPGGVVQQPNLDMPPVPFDMPAVPAEEEDPFADLQSAMAI